MKRIVGLGTLLGVMALSAAASANVSKAELFVGRMSVPQSCFVMVKLETVEQNMFNGQEKLKVGDTELGSFAPLQSAGRTSLKPGDHILFGSDKFKTEVGFEPDISIPDASCEQLAPGAEVSFQGSFGPVAALLGLPPAFSELDVVGQALLLHLESEKFTLRSLSGEKEIGATGGSSSGASSSGGASSGGTTSGGTTSGGASTTPATSGGAPATGSGDDGGCAVSAGASRSTAGGLFALGVLGVATALARRRRSAQRW